MTRIVIIIVLAAMLLWVDGQLVYVEHRVDALQAALIAHGCTPIQPTVEEQPIPVPLPPQTSYDLRRQQEQEESR